MSFSFVACTFALVFASVFHLIAVLGKLANHWRYLNTTDYLADYGGAPNLLECVEPWLGSVAMMCNSQLPVCRRCVPTYIHYVAGVNAANVWMLHEYADMAAVSPQIALAQRNPAALRDDADSIAAAILNRLYVAPNGSEFSGGYFSALYPNGTLQVGDIFSDAIACPQTHVYRGISLCREFAT